MSIYLEDEELTFEVRTLQCLEDKDDIMILFAYGASLGEEYCERQVREALAAALTEKQGKATPAPQMKVWLNYPPWGVQAIQKGAPKSKYPAKMKCGL